VRGAESRLLHEFAIGGCDSGLPWFDAPHRQAEFKAIKAYGVFPHQEYRRGVRHRNDQRRSRARPCRYAFEFAAAAVSELQLNALNVKETRPCSRAHAQYLRLLAYRTRWHAWIPYCLDIHQDSL
jgi:hypothetical protein